MVVMSVPLVKAILDHEEVVVSSKEEANMLYQSGYGTFREDKSSVLSHCEVLYLLIEGRVKVVEYSSGVEVSFNFLLNRFRDVDPEIWTKFLIFRDLRSRGYVVKDGFGWDIDFRVYERGTFLEKAAKYIVYAISEGVPVMMSRIGEVLRLTHGMKRELIVAVVDRRGEIVYYSLEEFNLSVRSKSSE